MNEHSDCYKGHCYVASRAGNSWHRKGGSDDAAASCDKEKVCLDRYAGIDLVCFYHVYI